MQLAIFHLLTILLLGLIWLSVVIFLRVKKRKNFLYFLFFTMFYNYLIKVLDYTLFQFQSLLLLKHFVPGLMLNTVATAKSVNLIPLVTLTIDDVKTSLLNILLMIPFGFGLPFITDFRIKKVVIIGALLSINIELLQLITGLMARVTFRIADINDALFNTVGVVIGYLIFVWLVRLYRHIAQKRKWSVNPISRYIIDRPQIDA